MGDWHGGKGSSPRPMDNRKRFEDNWDRIFNKNKQNEKGDPISLAGTGGLRSVTGGSFPALMWTYFMKEASKDLPKLDFPPPPGVLPINTAPPITNPEDPTIPEIVVANYHHPVATLNFFFRAEHAHTNLLIEKISPFVAAGDDHDIFFSIHRIR